MADEEVEQDNRSIGRSSVAAELMLLRQRLQELDRKLRESGKSVQSAAEYCQQFCQALVEYAGKWKISEDPLPLLEIYTLAIRSYCQAHPYLSSECENVPLVLQRLVLSCIELVLCLPEEFPDRLWEEFRTTVQSAHAALLENGSSELQLLEVVSHQKGIWTNAVLQSILRKESLDPEKVDSFLSLEGPLLLDMRIKHLLKEGRIDEATALAKLCSDHPEFGAKISFKQTYLVCLCSSSSNEKLLEEISEIDCKDALEMICNLESEGDEKNALVLCTAFLTRQLRQGEMYCAWELTLFWSKLQRRVESSVQVYLDRCRQLSMIAETVYHIFFLIKVIQSEVESIGLPTCIEMCVRALRMESSENTTVKTSICKTISCLLPDDLEVKRACQLTEFLLEPTVDAFYAVETLYNQPDQKFDEENLPVPNSLRCEIILVLKTQWPFDPEFWDWKTLKRHCLALMGEEASIVSSIDELNDSEVFDMPEEEHKSTEVEPVGLFPTYNQESVVRPVNSIRPVNTEKKKRRTTAKQMREKGFVSARFRNWQAYMQYCVLCDKEFLGHRIVRHSQKHFCNGVYTCPICTETFSSKEQIIPHVALHVKQSSKQRLANMRPVRRAKPGRPPKVPGSTTTQKAKPVRRQQHQLVKNNLKVKELFLFSDVRPQKFDNRSKGTQPRLGRRSKDRSIDEFRCPVTNCKKSFRYFKNLIAHCKRHNEEEAKVFLELQSNKVICQYCRRHFVSIAHLNDHLQMHCGSKPYICIQLKCKASFNSYSELLTHRKEHTAFRAKCMFPSCGRIFSESYLLYDHEAHHYDTYTCKFPNCGKVYHSHNELLKHSEEHSLHQVSSPLCHSTLPAEIIQPPSRNDDAQEIKIKMEVNEDIAVSQSNTTSGIVAPGQVMPAKFVATLGTSVQVSHVADLIKSEIQATAAGKQPANATTVEDTLQFVSSDKTTAESAGSSFGVSILNSSILSAKSRVPTCLSPSEAESGSTQPQINQLCTSVADVFSGDGIPALSKRLSSGSIEPSEADKKLNDLIPFNMPKETLFKAVSSGLPVKNKMEVPSVCALPLKMIDNFNVAVPQSKSSPSVVPGESEVKPVRAYPCKVDGCPRSYSSTRSLTKHMKSTHPEQYAEIKLAQRNRRRRPKANNVSDISTDQKLVTFLQPQTGVLNKTISKRRPRTRTKRCSSTPLDTVNPLTPAQLGVASTSLRSQMKINQSDPKSASLLVDLQKHLNVDSASGHVSSESSSSTNSIRTKQLHSRFRNSAVKYIKEESSLDSLISSKLDGVSNEDASSQHSSKLKREQKNGPTLRPKKPRQSRRSKCPAIIKDGKFICSRCFRAFTNPRSLGGHLSRGSVCKPFEPDETPPEVIESNGHSSVLASVMLSSSAVSVQQPQESAFSRSTNCRESRLQSLTSKRQQASSLHNGFYKQNSSNFNASRNEAGSGSNQTLESSRVPAAFESTGVPQEMLSSGNSAASQVDASRPSNSASSQMSGAAVLPSKDLLLSTLENGLLTSSFSETTLPQNVDSKSARISVISGPQSTDVAQLSVKRESSSPSPGSSGTESSYFGNSSKNIASKKLMTMAVRAKSLKESKQLIGAGHHMGLLTETDPPFLVANQTSESSETATDVKHYNSPDPVSPDLLVGLKENANLQAVDKLLQHELKDGTDLQMAAGTVTRDFQKNVEASAVVANVASTVSNLTESFQVQGGAEGAVIDVAKNLKGNCDPLLTSTLHVESALDIKMPVINELNHEISSADFCSSDFSETVDGQIADILEALERLNLEKEDQLTQQLTPNQLPEKATGSLAVSEISEGSLSQTVVTKQPPVVNDCSPPAHKPFACKEKGCDYGAMTKDALFKHYGRVHHYSPEMMMEVRKRQLKFAPFKCVVPNCTKTFTRNSNLKAHCLSVHHFSQEEMAKLRVKRPYSRKSTSEGKESSTAEAQPIKVQASTVSTTALQPAVAQLTVTQQATLQSALSPPSVGLPSATQPVPAQKIGRVKARRRKVKPEFALGNLLQKGLFTGQVGRKPRREKTAKLKQSGLPSQNGTGELSSLKPRRRNRKPDGRRLKKQSQLNKPGPYKPYQCVHKDCTAAFTIQQNLLLHYRSMHRSEIPTFLQENEDETETCIEKEQTKPAQLEAELSRPVKIENNEGFQEYRCQIKDCSRIFQEVTSLIQHYIKLHEIAVQEIESMFINTDLKLMKCDQPHCTSSFMDFCNYVTHLELAHEFPVKRNIEEEGIFRCDCEGCDRVYATRSNLLRHIYLKHNERHDSHLMRPRKLLASDQENVSRRANREYPYKQATRMKLKMGKPGSRPRGRPRLKLPIISEGSPTGRSFISLKCGQYTFDVKTREDALAMCTENFLVQFPCMILGCSAIAKTEHSILRHYKNHNLDRELALKHRSLLVICKRRPSHLRKHPLTDKGETTQTGTEETASEDSVLNIYETHKAEKYNERLDRDVMDELSELFSTKLINNDGLDLFSNQGENMRLSEKDRLNSSLKRSGTENDFFLCKRKKVERFGRSLTERNSTQRSEESAAALGKQCNNKEQQKTFDLSTFKPMGFEVSFLKFLEESATKQKKKTTSKDPLSGTVKDVYVTKSPAESTSSGDEWSSSVSQRLVEFANPSHLHSVENIKIVLDESFAECEELMLQQLQKMKPVVVLKHAEVNSDSFSDTQSLKDSTVEDVQNVVYSPTTLSAV
ncbi:zinc finger protein 292 [Protopterus annectens]|uniref:zinc finger protein 292 n=1 Tax=Protopterus annectens TaxID=7888 RepID=UPI001CFC3B47|nr:zinc finger protein 292 [Protopterus annectens]